MLERVQDGFCARQPTSYGLPEDSRLVPIIHANMCSDRDEVMFTLLDFVGLVYDIHNGKLRRLPLDLPEFRRSLHHIYKLKSD